jgi:ribosome maturation factor RimP
LVLPLVESLGLTLWGMEYAVAGRRSVLRIFIDAPSAPGSETSASDPGQGVEVKQCATVSRHISLALEVEELIPGSYTLEVSSPGVERLFFEPGQLPPYEGRELKLTLERPLPGPFPDRSRFTGILLHAGDQEFVLSVEGHELSVPWDNVKKARLVHRFPDTTEKPKAGR